MFGLVDTGALIGFGNSASSITLGSIIDLTSISDFAFVMPRNGTLDSISISFSVLTALSLVSSSIVVSLGIYTASIGSNSFTLISSINLPALSDTVTIGTIISQSASSLGISLTIGEKILIGVSATASGLSLVNFVSGYVSAGLNIV
ncbi:MAG: hypothetical protein NkDv07_0425 [Candidatus Improbicoccus devescovinae]|nr:MAG: hypothetical protein NkDv07_0425 [Candidatus Improbicoccus devescovinae]